MNEMIKIMTSAYKNKYAVPAINFESFEVLKGIALGAKMSKSPIIVQTTEPALEEMGIKNIVLMVDYYRKKYNPPMALHLDHATEIETIIRCIENGYKSVMIDCSDKSMIDNIRLTKDVVDYAHKLSVSVEGEMGVVGSSNVEDKKTDLESAIEYVKKTGVDFLAISIGNSHGGREKTRKIDFELLKEINLNLNIPLVLHGSSGVLNEDLHKVMHHGICKINIETELRMLYRESLEQFLLNNPDEIRVRKITGYLQDEISKFVNEKCKIFNCLNKEKLV